MIKTIREFSNFDVFAIVKELDSILSNSSILNIYEVEDLLLLKIKTKNGRKSLIIKRDSRINLTEYDYPIPNYPRQYIRSLRKLLKNRTISKISQHKFDRIIVIELSYDNKPWKFVIELFNKGNYLLLNENNIIKIAKKYKIFKDRIILANKEYIFPKSQKYDFLTIDKKGFCELFSKSNIEIVRIISRKIHISGLYSEEICHRAKIDKKTLSENLTDQDYVNLFDAFKKVRNKLLFSEIDAQIILDQDGKEISVLPFEIEILKNYNKKKFPTFNEAVDEYFSKIDSEALMSPKDQRIQNLIKNNKKILRNQLEYLDELKNKKIKYYEIGELMYTNLHSLEKLLYVILNAREKGYNWHEINNKLNNAKKEKINETEFFEKIIPSTKQLLLKLNDYEVYMDLRKSIGENANHIYTKGKKAEKKIIGTLKAIKKSQDTIKKLEIEKESIELEVDFLLKKPKKKWYEKFRWFITSDNFLIIGGRDSTSNEIIFKKHLDPTDLVFHTNFPGSPLVVIKNPENLEITPKSIQETAIFVASFSRAWKENWGVVDVFYIKPNQISKSPPSGEFLSKGSFIISGKKNFIKNVKTELAIGLIFVELDTKTKEDRKVFYPKLMIGPNSAIQTLTNISVKVAPSKSTGLTKGKLAKEIKSYFIKNVNEELRIWVKLLSLDVILLYLPSGFSIILI